MNKLKKIVLASVLAAAFSFGVGATAHSINGGTQYAGCYGSYANGVGEVVPCGS